MALVSSTMLPLGTALPRFELPDTVSGKLVSSHDFDNRPLVVIVMAPHCPYVKHIKRGIARLGTWLHEEEVPCVAVCASDETQYPDDGPKALAAEARDIPYRFPYLFDEDQAFVRALEAMATPEFYVFDDTARLIYRGQMDDARPNNQEPCDGRDIKAAISRMKEGLPPLETQKPSIGCSIKWKPGREPDYAVGIGRGR